MVPNSLWEMKACGNIACIWKKHCQFPAIRFLINIPLKICSSELLGSYQRKIIDRREGREIWIVEMEMLSRGYISAKI